MGLHRVTFSPSGRTTLVSHGSSVMKAALAACEPLHTECGGRGACGRCLVRVLDGTVPEHCILRREIGLPEVLACLTPVHEPLTILPLVDAELPRLVSKDNNIGLLPLGEWAPWPLNLSPIVDSRSRTDLGVALDIGTTTLRLLLIRLADGVVIGEAGAYNPQIPRGADVINRIVAAEQGLLQELAQLVRDAVREMVDEAAAYSGASPRQIRGYVAAGNPSMTHLLLAVDPSGIRQIPSQPLALAFPPARASELGWPGAEHAPVLIVPAAGGWVGGDIMAGAVRAGLSRTRDELILYVDLGTNGEVVLGGRDFSLACACSAGPAFEGGGIRCGIRAGPGAIDGAGIDEGLNSLQVSVIGGGTARGICGSGLIALTDALFRAGWIDRSGRFTSRAPEHQRVNGAYGMALALSEDRHVALWERDLISLIRAKAAIFAGIRSLLEVADQRINSIRRVIVSGNFGRFLNLPAAVGIGLLPSIPLGRYDYVDNGSLEGAALSLLSEEFSREVDAYLKKVTYVDLADLPGYMDEFVGASFLPHTNPEYL